MSTRVRWLLGAVVAVVALAAGLAWWFLLRDTAPGPAVLPDPPGSFAATSSGSVERAVTEPSAAAVPAAATPDGTWVAQAGPEVFAGYRVQEQWVDDTVERTVVGRTPGVTGRVELAGPYLAAAVFDVDLTQLRSGWDERDAEMQLVLDTAQFPSATLTLAEPVRIPVVVSVGTPVAVEVPAALTIKGVSQPVRLSVEARWNGDTLDVAGGTEIGLEDFGVDTGSGSGLVEVGEQATVEFVVRLVRG